MVSTMSKAPEELDPQFKAFYDAAIAYGYEEWPLGGPWGLQDHERGIDPRTGQLYKTGERREGDRSVCLMKGDILLWLVDRDHLRSGIPERGVDGWFNNGTHAMSDEGLEDAVRESDPAAIEKLRNICTECGDESKELTRVAFANAACPACLQVARAKYEFPGWAD